MKSHLKVSIKRMLRNAPTELRRIMAGARKLEDLEAWICAKSLVQDVYRLTREAPARNDFGFCSQLRNAAVSIMSNIAEGFGRSSDKEFARFLDIARGSTFETQSLLHVARDVSYLDAAASEKLLAA